MKYIIMISMLVIFLLSGCISLEDCPPEKVCEEKNNTIVTNTSCPIVEEKTCPVVEEKTCPVCSTNNDSIVVLKGENKYEIGLIYQRFADDNIEAFEDYYYDKKFDNCSIEIESARDHLITSMGFYGLAQKEFEKIPEDIIAKEYIIAMKEMINHNEDLIEYLKDYDSFCNNYADNDVDATPRNLKDRDNWEEKYILHKANFDKQIRIIEELRK